MECKLPELVVIIQDSNHQVFKDIYMEGKQCSLENCELNHHNIYYMLKYELDNSAELGNRVSGSVFKDAKGNKANNVPDAGVENARASIEEMSAIFSADNFPSLTHSEEKLGRNEKDADLDIDDIEIEDPVEKQKGNPMVAALNKQNLTNTFQALKGKFMPMKVKNDKAPINDAPQDDKADTVGQIKKRYGYTASAEPSATEAAKSKLSENLKKLQGINIRSAEMQDQAKSFSSMAKEVLRFSGNDKANS